MGGWGGIETTLLVSVVLPQFNRVGSKGAFADQSGGEQYLERGDMTGWMIYQNGGFPVAHADALLSARVGKDISSILPTIEIVDELGKLTNNNNSGFVSTGMCQKIVIISHRVLYIWAGPLREAVRLDKLLRDLESNNKLYDKYILEKITEEFSKDEDFSAILWICYKYPESVIMHIGAEVINIPDFGSTIYGGWGEGEFFALTYDLQATIDPKMALEKYDLGEMSKAESDSYTRMRLMDALLQYRVATEQLRHVATGGAIETAALYPDGFRKMGDYLYVFFFDEDSDSVGFIPRILIKKTYASGYLGVSITNYGIEEFKSVTVPNPGNKDRPFYITPSVHNPWKGDLAGVCCIFNRGNGTISYYMEDANIFRKNVYLDEVEGKIVVSDWYIADMTAKRLKRG